MNKFFANNSLRNNLTTTVISVLASTAFLSMAEPAKAASFLGVNVIDNSPFVKGSSPMPIPHSTQTFMGDGKTYEFSVDVPGLGSRGKSLSHFGLMSGGTFTALFTKGLNSRSYDPGSKAINDWLGTCNITIKQPCTVEYTFTAGVEYQLGLWTGPSRFTAFGVAQQDSYTFSTRTDQHYPNSLTPQYVANHPDRFLTVAEKGAYFLGMEDGLLRQGSSGSYSHDYQDWVVKATPKEEPPEIPPTSVPEPSTLLGVSFIALGAGLTRQRRKGKKQ